MRKQFEVLRNDAESAIIELTDALSYGNDLVERVRSEAYKRRFYIELIEQLDQMREGKFTFLDPGPEEKTK